MYRSEKQLVYDLCDESLDSETRKIGEFDYDFDLVGIDFNDVNLPRIFRNLKGSVARHIEGKSHKSVKIAQIEQDNKDRADEVYNQKVGKKLAMMI